MNSFRLQRLLEQRQREADAARLRLARAVRAAERSADTLASLKTTEEALYSSAGRALGEGGAGPSDLTRLGLQLDAAQEAIDRQQEDLLLRRESELAERQRAVAAETAHRALQRAREQHEARVRDDQRRREVRELDELSGVRAAREMLQQTDGRVP